MAFALAVAGLAVISPARATWPPPSPTGPFALSNRDDNGNAIDEPIPGFVGPEGDGIAPYDLGDGTILYNDQYVNPAFVGWATNVVDYSPARPDMIDLFWLDPTVALGPVSGDVFDVTSLGDPSSDDLAQGVAPGSITLEFDTGISNGPGPDFVVFGNAFNLNGDLQVFSKLAYVEVSSNGTDFARFPCVDTNPHPASAPWSYMLSNPTLIYNLFGKANNAYGQSWGVPFDLNQLAQHPLIAAGKLDLQHVRYVRLVAVVGNGSTSLDTYNHPIYDPWPTMGSPGPEVQAVGVLHAPPTFANWAAAITDAGQRGALDIPAGDGIPNLLAYALGATAGQLVPAALRPIAKVNASKHLGLAFPTPTRADVNLVLESSPTLGATAVWTTLAQSNAGAAWAALTNGQGAPLSTLSISGTTITITTAALPAPGVLIFLRLRATTVNGS